MKYESYSVLFMAAVLASAACSNAVSAQTDLEKAMGSSSNWASQAGDYANHRYSELNQVNAGNVGKLQVAWSMSTGVLREIGRAHV